MANRKNRRALRAETRAARALAGPIPTQPQHAPVGVSPLSMQPIPPAAPIRDPALLTDQFSPAPTISRWIAQAVQGELLWGTLDGIRRNAELGLTEQWGDLTRRFLATDDHVFSTYRTYVAAVANARREVVAPKVAPELQGIADAQAEMCARMLDEMPNPERSIGDLIDADFTGYSVAEIMWQIRGEWLWPRALDWVHPDRIRFSQQFTPYLWDRGAAALRAKELGMSDVQDVAGLGLALPQNKYVVHLPRIIPNYPMTSGIFLSIMRPWWVKNWTMKFMLSGAELAGLPRIVGTLPVDSSAPDEARQALYNALTALSADSIGVVSGGTSIEMLDPKMQGAGSIWDMIIKQCNAAISKAILGSTLNVEVGDSGGNRSLGESQADMTIAPRWNASATLVGNTLSAQLFKPFLELNRHCFDGHVFVPRLKLHISEDEPSVTDKAVDVGAVTFNELRRACRLEPWTVEEGGEKVIPAMTTPADANIYKAQVAVDPSAIPPNGTPPVSPDATGVAAPRPFPKLAAARGVNLRALATRLR